MKRFRYSLFIYLSAILGCSTAQVHIDDNYAPYPYAGTGLAMDKTVSSITDYDFFGETFVWLFDIPMCLIADTVLLPYDAYRVITDE